MSLPRQHRLKSWRHFAQVYRRGGRWRSRCVILRGLQVTNTPDPITTQIGISIGRKTSKRAVVRNQLKRQVRHAFRQLLPQLESGWLLVAVLPPQA
ncbi:MAG: ribonuclease P protein component [Cyanobacteria bacterium P01_H01_bin.15]